jgi:hypothetical protein
MRMGGASATTIGQVRRVKSMRALALSGEHHAKDQVQMTALAVYSIRRLRTRDTASAPMAGAVGIARCILGFAPVFALANVLGLGKKTAPSVRKTPIGTLSDSVSARALGRERTVASGQEPAAHAASAAGVQSRPNASAAKTTLHSATREAVNAIATGPRQIAIYGKVGAISVAEGAKAPLTAIVLSASIEHIVGWMAVVSVIQVGPERRAVYTRDCAATSVRDARVPPPTNVCLVQKTPAEISKAYAFAVRAFPGTNAISTMASAILAVAGRALGLRTTTVLYAMIMQFQVGADVCA